MRNFQPDRIDLSILAELQKNNRLHNQELAERVAVSAPTCLRRVRRLRQAGLIEKDVAILNAGKAGSFSFFIVHLELHEESKDKMAQLEREFRALDSVLQAYLVTGDWDYTLIVCTHSIQKFREFIDAHIYSNPSVKKFLTQTVLKQVKQTTALPLSAVMDFE